MDPALSRDGEAPIKKRGSAPAMQTVGNLVVFVLGGKRCALRLSAVERVLRAVAVTPVSEASEMIIGVVAMPGRVLPVVDLHSRLGLPRKEIELSDRFLVTHTSRASLIIVADAVEGVIEYEPGALVPIRRILPKTASVDGLVCFSDGLSYIHDLDAFLALDGVRAPSNLAPSG
jgi:purine-binding chemotaxis protein CheW